MTATRGIPLPNSREGDAALLRVRGTLPSHVWELRPHTSGCRQRMVFTFTVSGFTAVVPCEFTSSPV